VSGGGGDSVEEVERQSIDKRNLILQSKVEPKKQNSNN
jgi:hypothetical protein